MTDGPRSGSGGWGGCRTAKRWRSSRRCSTTAVSSTCCCSNTTTCSPTGHTPISTRNLRCDPAAVGADFVAVNRGGDITYHGPGQLVGYPIVSLPERQGVPRTRAGGRASADRRARPSSGCRGAGRLREYPGCLGRCRRADPRKIAAIGVRLARGRTMHGFALNVTTDMAYLRQHIVACGIADRPVTSLAEEGIDVVDAPRSSTSSPDSAPSGGAAGRAERQDVAWQHRRRRPRAVLAWARARATRSRSGRRVRTPGWSRPGVTERAVDRVPQARLAAPQGAARAGGAAAQEDHPRPRPRHRLRGRRAAPTSPSAGPTARRRSWCWASAAPGRAASAWSTPASRSSRPPTSRPGRRSGRSDGARPRRAHDGGPRRSRRRGMALRRGVCRGDPTTPAAGPGRDVDLRREG